jgi:thioredoxin 1
MTGINASDEDFSNHIKEDKRLVLVDFWAEWCGPCRQLLPIINELASELSNDLKVVKVNIDENPETPTKYGVRGIPTLMLFKDGKHVSTKVGALPKSNLIEWINDNK